MIGVGVGKNNNNNNHNNVNVNVNVNVVHVIVRTCLLLVAAWVWVWVKKRIDVDLNGCPKDRTEGSLVTGDFQQTYTPHFGTTGRFLHPVSHTMRGTPVTHQSFHLSSFRWWQKLGSDCQQCHTFLTVTTKFVIIGNKRKMWKSCIVCQPSMNWIVVDRRGPGTYICGLLLTLSDDVGIAVIVTEWMARTSWINVFIVFFTPTSILEFTLIVVFVMHFLRESAGDAFFCLFRFQMTDAAGGYSIYKPKENNRNNRRDKN